jgi:hypothetical protein
MRSKHLLKFGIPDVEHQVEVNRDTHGLPCLFFRSRGNPLMGLNLTGLSQLEQLLETDGDLAGAHEVRGYIDQARQLGIGKQDM